jgi:hypothetical protein
VAITYDATAGSPNNGTNAASITLAWLGTNYPAGGSLVLAQLCTTTVTGALTLPDADWTLVSDVTNAGGTVRTVLARRWYAPGDPTAYAFTFASTRLIRGVIHARGGVSVAAPIDAGPSSAEGTGTSLTHGLTTATAGALLLGVCGSAGNRTTAPSAGWTERHEFAGVCAVELAEQAVATPASVSGTWTHSVSGAGILTLVALRDAGAAPPAAGRSQAVVAG